MEALIKIDDGLGYEKGDVVVIRRNGWRWSKLEKRHFRIVGLSEKISEEEIKDLGFPISVSEPVRSLEGEDDKRLLPERQYIIKKARFNLNLSSLVEKLSSEERKKIGERNCEFQPFRFKKLEFSDFEDKMSRPEVLKEIKKRMA